MLSQNDDKKDIFFNSREYVYSAVINEHNDTMGLIDTIKSSEYKNQQVHYYTRIRRNNGCIGLYETEALKKWIDRNPIDPITRQNISFQKPRVDAKLSWMKKFDTMKTSDITSAFKQKILNDYITNPIENREAARAFVDISTFYDCGFVHKNLSFKNTNKTAGNGWLLRMSSKHGSDDLEKNTQIVVFSTGTIQKRLVEVDGMGFIYYNGNDIYDPLKCINSVHLCLIDAIEANLGVIPFKSIVIPVHLDFHNSNKKKILLLYRDLILYISSFLDDESCISFLLINKQIYGDLIKQIPLRKQAVELKKDIATYKATLRYINWESNDFHSIAFNYQHAVENIQKREDMLVQIQEKLFGQ